MCQFCLSGTAQIDIDPEQSMLNRANKGSFAVIKTITTELTLFYSGSKTQKATIPFSVRPENEHLKSNQGNSHNRNRRLSEMWPNKSNI